MYFILSIFLVLSILYFLLSTVSSQTKLAVSRLQLQEIARQIAAGACEEAFAVVWHETANVNSDLFNFFLEASKDERQISLQLLNNITNLIPAGFTLNITAKISIYDFQKEERITKAKFYGQEGLGIFQLHIDVKLLKNKKVVANTEIIRHHDFKILSTVSKRNRESYVNNFLLDFVLFVRQGRDEFLDPALQGELSSFNNPSIRLIIEDQDKYPEELRGKIFFGGTDILNNFADKPVFFNIHSRLPNYNKILPIVEENNFEISFSDCCSLFPELSNLNSSVGGKLETLKGVFKSYILPVDFSGSAEQELLNFSMDSFLSKFPPNSPERNVFPGLLEFAQSPHLLTDAQYANSIMAGAIRQRFLHLVTFTLATQSVQIGDQEIEKRLASMKFLSMFPGAGNPLELKQKIIEIQEKRRPPFPLTSDFVSSVLLRSGEKPNPLVTSSRDSFDWTPTFHGIGNNQLSLTSSDFRPYARFSLRFREFDFPEYLSESNIISPESGELTLRGIVRVIEGAVPLYGKNGAPLLFKGKGVLIADDGFIIKSGIKRHPNAAPDDFCVLFTPKGNIEIETDQEIEASLIAIGNRGTVIPRKPFKIFGNIVVDRLKAGFWPKGNYLLKYNPALSTAIDKYQIVISPQISFQRIIEGQQ